MRAYAGRLTLSELPDQAAKLALPLVTPQLTLPQTWGTMSIKQLGEVSHKGSDSWQPGFMALSRI